ncbi:cytochrome C biogenesis protein [Neisseria canis]|uniref:Uncharacterized protein n=1 Tax=Neisseria canis TaxID=493 RepID=A0A3S5E880_9NEIS|nr:cytochrome C biogenesis protein [Neisseria canis]VEF00382.1 Uncharacterised protein [Neisseria canis]
MFNKIKIFIQKYWISFLVSWFCLWLWMSYYGNDIVVKLTIFPIISFSLLLSFYLELERKNCKYLSIIQVLFGMMLGLLIQIKRENILIVEGIILGGLWGLATPIWVKLFVFFKNKIGNYI